MTSLTYRQAFEIAATAKRHREMGGHHYLCGVERAAALAAVPQPCEEAVIMAISETFKRFEIPHARYGTWDGSIA